MSLDTNTIKAWLAADKAVWERTSQAATVPVGLAVRYWTVPTEAAGEVAEWLRANTDAGNASASFKVSTPAARLTTGQTHALTGDWRGGEVGIDYRPQNPQEQNRNFMAVVRQELRQGWVTAIVTGGTVDYTTALPDYDKLRKTLTLTWVAIAKTAMQSCAEAVPATLTSPAVQGNSFTGTWVRKGAVRATLDERGDARLVATFSTEPDEVGTHDTGVFTNLIPEAKNRLETQGRYTKRFDDRAAAISAAQTLVTTLVAGNALTLRMDQGPEGAQLDAHVSTAVLADSLWLPHQDGYTTGYVRIIENCTLDYLLAALALTDSTLWRVDGSTPIGPNASYSISPRPSLPPHADRFSVHLHASMHTGSAGTGASLEQSYFASATAGMTLQTNADGWTLVKFQVLVTASKTDAQNFLNDSTVNGHASGATDSFVLVARAGPYATKLENVGRRMYRVMRVYAK